MDWKGIFGELTKTTAIVLAIGWVARYAITQFFAVELEKSKSALKAVNDRDLEYVKAALARLERLQADLVKSRGAAYGEIWRLTGSLNLFGPATTIDGADLSAQLKNWYFERGWVLTSESKRRYFLVQELLNFLMLQSIPFRRPADRQLFGSRSRPLELLRQLRSRVLKIESRGDEGEYKVGELEEFVSAWKSQVLDTQVQGELEEQAWLLLQFVLSAFRSGVIAELGSSDRVEQS
jgi:hypothetical protein